MRRLVTAIATAAAIAFSTQAYAQATLTPGDIFTPGDTDTGGHLYAENEFATFLVSDPGGDGMGPISATFSHQGVPDSGGATLIDHFLFTILDNGIGSGSVTTSVTLDGLLGPLDTDIISVYINGVLADHTTDTALTDQWSANAVPITYGVLNDIAIEYLSRGQGHYSGTAEFTPNVPEPATWGMMLLGFGAIGFTLRRSRKSRELAQAA